MGLVVFHHLWPTVLTGGFVGVDAFFVISGYIIGAQLIHELNGTGRIRIADFYARRVRRLLPAALLVLTSVVVAVHTLAPQDRWGDHARRYWPAPCTDRTGCSAPNPSTRTRSPPWRYFWSLSVEEQFYLVWPLLLLLLFKLRAPRWPASPATTGLGLVSLLWCVRLTESDPAAAYFVTQVRVWEFAIGAAIALAGTRLALPKALATATSLLGLALLVGSAVHYTGLTPTPAPRRSCRRSARA